MINAVAIAAMMKADPHRASAKTFGAGAMRATEGTRKRRGEHLMATNVGRSNTMTTTDAGIQPECSGNVRRPELAVTILPGS